MSWKDFLTTEEREELERAEAAKRAAAESYNAIRLTLKTRCDARMRRAGESRKPSDGGGAG